MEKMAWDGPKWGREDFFLLIQALPTFWAERIWILRTFIFFIFWIPKFWISRSQKSGFPGLQKIHTAAGGGEADGRTADGGRRSRGSCDVFEADK